MSGVSASLVVAAPPSVVFAYVDDASHATAYVEGLTRWEPVGERTSGPGTVIEAEMSVGGSTKGSTVEITRWERDVELHWEPRGGFKQKGGFAFAPEGEGTRVTFTLSLELPGGFAGRLLAKSLDGAVRGVVERSLASLAAQVEAS